VKVLLSNCGQRPFTIFAINNYTTIVSNYTTILQMFGHFCGRFIVHSSWIVMWFVHFFKWVWSASYPKFSRASSCFLLLSVITPQFYWCLVISVGVLLWILRELWSDSCIFLSECGQRPIQNFGRASCFILLSVITPQFYRCLVISVVVLLCILRELWSNSCIFFKWEVSVHSKIFRVLFRASFCFQ
jgi:hypothetical protein